MELVVLPPSLPIVAHFAPEELLGYVAAALVLATFTVKSMGALRLIAILSNLAFIGYASVIGSAPIFVLHSLLLPLNAWRLAQLRDASRASGPPTGNVAKPEPQRALDPHPQERLTVALIRRAEAVTQRSDGFVRNRDGRLGTTHCRVELPRRGKTIISQSSYRQRLLLNRAAAVGRRFP